MRIAQSIQDTDGNARALISQALTEGIRHSSALVSSEAEHFALRDSSPSAIAQAFDRMVGEVAAAGAGMAAGTARRLVLQGRGAECPDLRGLVALAETIERGLPVEFNRLWQIVCVEGQSLEIYATTSALSVVAARQQYTRMVRAIDEAVREAEGNLSSAALAGAPTVPAETEP